MTDLDSYVARINRVVDFIDDHLDERLDLDTLARLAHISSWHFHRIFQARTGETPGAHVRRKRVETAAQRLLATPPASVLRIALEVGFASPEVFTRAFKSHFGVTPTAWRDGAARDWAERRQSELRKIHQEERKNRQEPEGPSRQDPRAWSQNSSRPPEVPMKVDLRELPETHAAYLRAVGPYGSSHITRTWERFAAWCAPRGLLRPRRRMFGISHDSPDLTAPELCRYDACVEVEPGFAPDSLEVSVQRIPGGLFACTAFRGTSAEVHDGWMAMYGRWLTGSHFQADDRPALELYEPEDHASPTGTFTCTLCVPVRA